MKGLRDLPSDFLEDALKDMGKARRSKKYILNMTYWHRPSLDPRSDACEVCMAGSVIAFRLEGRPDTRYEACDFDNETYGKLEAIDAFREGSIRTAFILLDIPLKDSDKVELHKAYDCAMEYPELNYRRSVYYWRRFIRKLRELGY